MCLDAVNEIYDHPSPVVTDGWKEIDARKPRFQFNVNGTKDIPFDRWLTATNEHAKSGIKADDGQTYEPGFHIYADEKELKRKNSCQRVFVRGITCLGKQDGMTVVIAREMYLPSDKNGWPPRPDDKPSLLDRAKNVILGNA